MRILGASDPRKCPDGATIALYYPLGTMFTQTKDFSHGAMTKLTVCVGRMLFVDIMALFCISTVILSVVGFCGRRKLFVVMFSGELSNGSNGRPKIFIEIIKIFNIIFEKAENVTYY